MTIWYLCADANNAITGGLTYLVQDRWVAKMAPEGKGNYSCQSIKVNAKPELGFSVSIDSPQTDGFYIVSVLYAE